MCNIKPSHNQIHIQVTIASIIMSGSLHNIRKSLNIHRFVNRNMYLHFSYELHRKWQHVFMHDSNRENKILTYIWYYNNSKMMALFENNHVFVAFYYNLLTLLPIYYKLCGLCHFLLPQPLTMKAYQGLFAIETRINTTSYTQYLRPAKYINLSLVSVCFIS